MRVDVTNDTVAGRGGAIPIRDYRPSEPMDGAVPFLWIHGGGFAAGSLEMKESDAVAMALAERGRWVRTVDYRLAPNFLFKPWLEKRPSPNRFPAAIEDVVDALADLDAGSGARSAIGGASAGAGLAAGTLVQLRADGTPLPPSVLLAYGAFHPGLPPLPDDVRARTSGLTRGFQFSPTFARRLVLNYAGSEDLARDHRAFAGGGDLTGFPPALLIDADRDTLRASGVLFAGELRQAGVEVDYRVAAGTRHGFLNRLRTPQFADAIAAMDRWMTSHPSR